MSDVVCSLQAPCTPLHAHIHMVHIWLGIHTYDWVYTHVWLGIYTYMVWYIHTYGLVYTYIWFGIYIHMVRYLYAYD
jgi:hypothetical protein